MFGTRTPDELAAALAQNAEQAAIHQQRINNSPMMSESTRKAIADHAAAQAAYESERLTAAQYKAQLEADKAAMRDLCTNPKLPTDVDITIHSELLFAVRNTPADYEAKVAAMSEDDQRQAMQYYMAQTDAELEIRGLAPLNVKERAKVIAMMIAKRISMLSTENILICFGVLCDAGLRRPTQAAVKRAEVAVAAEKLNENPYNYSTQRDAHDRFDRELREKEALAEAQSVGLSNPAMVQNCQQQRVMLGQKIDETVDNDPDSPTYRMRVDDMSSGQYLRYETRRTGKFVGSVGARYNS